VVLAVYHHWVLPRPASDRPAPHQQGVHGFASEFARTFKTFFAKPDLLRILAFLLLYRLAESQLLKLAAPFMLDARDKGGLGLSTQQVGWAYGTAGVLALIAGGVLGGWVISRTGLKRAMWPLVAAINVPNALYIWLALAQPQSIAAVTAAIAVEQFGYGFGFAAYMVAMLMIASQDSARRTAHYAICTGFMALGMMLPGMGAGWLQQQLGYVNFFVWVCIATLPSFAAALWLKIDPEFGKRAESLY
jgi:PAT family beta-lactamase induction signal transducer AmpG